MSPEQARAMLQRYYDKQIQLSPQNVDMLNSLAYPNQGGSMQPTMVSNQSIPSTPTSHQLSPDEEAAFQDWFHNHANKYGISSNADDPRQNYDTRGFYTSMMSGQDESPDLHHGHMSSDFKAPGNERRYLKDSQGNLYDTTNGKYLNSNQPVSQKEMDMGETAPTLDQAKTLLDLHQSGHIKLNKDNHQKLSQLIQNRSQNIIDQLNNTNVNYPEMK